MSRLSRTRPTLLLCTTVTGALIAACAGADPPVVSSKLAGEIRAQYEIDAGAPSNGGSGGGAANAGSNAVASATGGSSAAPPATPADSDGSGGSAGTASPPEVVDSAVGGSGGGTATPPSSSCDGFAVLAANCGSSGCHGDGSNLENFAASEKAARAFIDKPGTLACTGQGNVIDPDDPDGSLMILKLSADPPCGSSMPLGGVTLPKSDIDCIRSWMGDL